MLKSSTPSIILHAGGPKTGSGSIQRAFNPQAKEPQIRQSLLDQLGFRFLHSKLNTSANLGRLHNGLVDAKYTDMEINAWRQWLLSQIKKSGCHSQYVFSAESAGSPKLRYDRAARLASFIESLGTMSHVIYYARPIMSLSLSLGLQNLKAGASQASIGTVARIHPNHIVTKYNIFKELYKDAKITFSCFERAKLVGCDIRLDIASRLGSSKQNLKLIKRDLSSVPPANEKIDRPILLIMRRIYGQLLTSESTAVPPIFNMFITMGKWCGPACTHLDLYSPAELEQLYEASIQEISSLKEAGNTFGQLAHFFEKSLLPKQNYMVSDRDPIDLSSYQFKMTLSQRDAIRKIRSKMRKMSLTTLPEYRRLSSILSDSHQTEYMALEILPDILTASMKVTV